MTARDIRWIALLASLTGACAEQRELVAVTETPTSTYLEDVAPLIRRACISCHSGDRPAGSYDLGSWRGLLGPGSDLERNALPGDQTSKLLTALDQEVHVGLLAETERRLLRRWVVEARLAYFSSAFHPLGWLYPGDRDALTFHGGQLRAWGWDLTPCEGCHGAALDDSRTGAACASCHRGGVNACGTCHGVGGTSGAPAPDLAWGIDPRLAPGVGAHAAHGPDAAAPVACSDCHQVPATVDAPGHLFDDGHGTTDLVAEVAFGARARLGNVSPSYDRTSRSCTVYCHGESLGAGGAARRPRWTAGPRGCDGCHEVPAGGGGPDCSTCHQQSVTVCKPGEPGCLATSAKVGVRFHDPQLHIDGQLPLGRKGLEGTCHACHGSEATAGAPAPDLHGQTAVTAVTVGLHRLHLTAGKYRAAVPCGSCHRVPQQIADPGHFDDDLPAEVVFSDLASGRLAHPEADPTASWDRATATCNVYCHSLDGARVTQWRWTSRLVDGVSCGACHGLPPRRLANGALHTLSTGCTICHASAYGPDGELDPNKHINGKVDQ